MQVPKNLIAWLKLLDVSAYLLGPPCRISPEYLVFWLQKASRHRRIKNGFARIIRQSREFMDAA